MRATGMPVWMVVMVALQVGLDRREWTDAARDRLRDAVQAQRDLGDDAERSFGAHEQPREVVAGRGFLGALRRLDDLAVRQHRFERQHVVLHGAVAHRVGAGRASVDVMPPSEASAPGIDRKEQALVAQLLVQGLARDAGLDHAVEVLRVDRQHPVHVAEIDANAAKGRVDLALQRGAAAERDYRQGRGAGADAHRCPARPSLDCGNTTASGGSFATQVVVIGVLLLAHSRRGDETGCRSGRRVADRWQRPRPPTGRRAGARGGLLLPQLEAIVHFRS